MVHQRNIQEKFLQVIKNNPFVDRKELEIQLGYSHERIKYHIQIKIHQNNRWKCVLDAIKRGKNKKD